MLTVLSFGGGQDSSAILAALIERPDFREKYAPKDLIVVMSDTGNEHPYTYEHVRNCQFLCSDHNIPFFFLEAGDAFHTEAWPNLIEPQIRNENGQFKPTMVQTGTKSCTDKLKLGPIYKFLDEYVNTTYFDGKFKIQKTRGCLKKALRAYEAEYGKLRVLIGFAKGEESRSNKALKLQEKEHREGGRLSMVQREFPLIDEGLTRTDCRAICTDFFKYEVMPSNCMLCPYQSLQELLWLKRNHPEQWGLWVRVEKQKLKRFEGQEKNYGVYCTKKTLEQKMEEAEAKYGDWTNQQLTEYKKSHGCTTNAM